MPINVFGNSSHGNRNKFDTSLLVQKPHLRTIYIESDREEDIDLKNQYKIKIYQVLLVLEKQLQKLMLILCSTILVY